MGPAPAPTRRPTGRARAEATARRRRLVRMRSDMAPLLRACTPCGGAGAYSGIRRREGSAQESRQLMQRTPRRQSMLGTEAWDIAVSMDFRCFSNARVHALEQWLRLPKLRGPEEGCAATSKAQERIFSRRRSACIAGSCDRLNGDRVRCASRESWQAIDASDASSAGGGRTLSHEQRQKRQCALPLARRVERRSAGNAVIGWDFPALPGRFPTEVVSRTPRCRPTITGVRRPFRDSYASFAIGFTQHRSG